MKARSQKAKIFERLISLLFICDKEFTDVFDVKVSMSEAYVHGYDPQENLRLQDQASTLVESLHCDTAYPAGRRVLEAGCGVGAQTVTLAKNSPKASIISIDISVASLIEAKRNVEAAGLTNVQFQQGDISICPSSRNHSIRVLRIYTEPRSKTVCFATPSSKPLRKKGD